MSEKPGAALTVKTDVALCVRLPLMPVIVKVYEPTGVFAEVVMFRVEDPEPLTEDGLNVPVAPVGNPLMLSETAPLKPPEAVMVDV